MEPLNARLPAQPPLRRSPWPDSQGLITLVAGSLLILISLITNYGYHALLQLRSLALNDQIGLSLHLAALAALLGDVELATRLRHRAANEAAEARNRADQDRSRADQDRNRAEEDREQTARRFGIQARCLAAQGRFLLVDSADSRSDLTLALELLLEELNPPGTM